MKPIVQDPSRGSWPYLAQGVKADSPGLKPFLKVGVQALLCSQTIHLWKKAVKGCERFQKGQRIWADS